MKLLIIIPAYNEKDNIRRVVHNLKLVCPFADYVVVNDGSKDGTGEICRKHGFNLIDLPVNLGLSGRFQAGVKYRREKDYDRVLQFDADGQHLPQFIKKMIDCMTDTGADIVIGSRFLEKEKPKTMRMLGSRIISWAIKITCGKKITDPTSGMRLYNRKMIEDFSENVNYTPEPDTISLILKNGGTVEEVGVDMAPRIRGESYFDTPGSIKYMLKMGFSIIMIQKFRKQKEQK
jgi:glycosyltransferase involved in cell wall biosynthesis